MGWDRAAIQTSGPVPLLPSGEGAVMDPIPNTPEQVELGVHAPTSRSIAGVILLQLSPPAWAGHRSGSPFCLFVGTEVGTSLLRENPVNGWFPMETI